MNLLGLCERGALPIQALIVRRRILGQTLFRSIRARLLSFLASLGLGRATDQRSGYSQSSTKVKLFRRRSWTSTTTCTQFVLQSRTGLGTALVSLASLTLVGQCR